MQHFAHVPRLLVALATHVRVAAIVERGELLDVPGVEPVIVLRHGDRRGIGRTLEYLRAARSMRASGFDTFFLRYSRLAACVLILTRPYFGHRVIYWSSGQADMPPPGGGRIGVRTRCNLWLNGWVLRGVDRVVTGPETMLAYMSRRWRIPPERVSLLYNDVDIDRFAPIDADERALVRKRLGWKDDEWVVLVVHRLAYRRGSRLLVPIVEQLVTRDVDDVRLVVIGDGPDATHLEWAIASSDDARDRISLAGGIPNADLPDWYRAADAFLMPSYEEGFPRVLLEAMASALPIVTTRAGGSADVVGTQYPFLVDIGDVGALVDAIATLRDLEPSERGELGAALRQRAVERYATDQVAGMLAELLSC
jgi:glycosyltransferase involved in cell wall biosynthesis